LTAGKTLEPLYIQMMEHMLGLVRLAVLDRNNVRSAVTNALQIEIIKQINAYLGLKIEIDFLDVD
jgi:hypothetical protein